MDSPQIFQIEYKENMNEMKLCARPRYFLDVTLVCRDGNYNCLDFSLVIDSSDIILQSCIQCNVESNCGIEEHFSSCSCISHKLCHNSWSGAPGALGLLGRPR